MKRNISLAALMLLALSSLFIPFDGVAVAATPKTESGKTCTIIGTAKSETLKGTSKNDVICGLGGNDVIVGNAGNDVIDGGAGSDSLRGGAGNDLLYGGSGNDNLQGESGIDSFRGGDGLNSCDLGEDSSETRDYTCSLLPRLDYLLHRVNGRIISPSVSFDGCTIQMYDFDNMESRVNAFAAGIIYGGGRFEVDAPSGNYFVTVNSLSTPDLQARLPQPKTCKAPKEMYLHVNPLKVDEGYEAISVTVDKFASTRVFVANSKGQPLQGAKVIGGGSYVNARVSPALSETYALVGYGQERMLGVTNKSGYLDILLPEGDFSLRAFVSFAGISLSSSSNLYKGNPTSLKIVLGK